MKIVIFEAKDWKFVIGNKERQNHEFVYVDEPLTPGNVHLHSDADIISIFVGSQPDNAVIRSMPRLKLIAARSTGFNHIDLATCAKNGVTVSNVPTYGAPTVAEHVFALLLGLSHHLIDAVARTRMGDFSYIGLRGFDLKGKTIGVIGTGAIGCGVIEIARGFSMRILANDIAPDDGLAQTLAFQYVDMDTLLRESDIITLHVPLNQSTRSLVGDSEFKKMKKGVVLINTARGEVVDTQALVDALNAGKIAAAGLDVLADEIALRDSSATRPDASAPSFENDKIQQLNHSLIAMPNVLVTPHSAFNTIEALERINEITLGNIISFIEGNPSNLVELNTRNC